MANCTILLIDYEPRSIERFRDPLVAAGYAVEIATDGVSGMEAFHRLNPDMVLVEAMIPKKHGFEVCQELKRTPHGRRTPVIITTGVYKGRKYRTQALHIYGCDEYIEKPIAAEQLLELVGKFFVPGSPGTSHRAAEPERESSGGGETPGAGENLNAIARPSPPMAKKDDTEDEIMARLDALLTGAGKAAPSSNSTERSSVVAAAENDPFAEMRAEINAEMGTVASPLPFETEPQLEPIPETLPSDQVMAPSVLEALPNPVTTVQPVTSTSSTSGLPIEESDGRVVSFDTKRHRKGKKAGRQGKGRSGNSTSTESAPEPAAVPAQPPSPAPQVVSHAMHAAEPRALDRPNAAPEMTLPRGTMVESELDEATAPRRKPVWLWVAVGVMVVAGLVFAFGRSGSNPSQPTATPAPPPTPTASDPVAIPPIAASVPPVESATAASVPKTSEPAPAPLNATKPSPGANKSAAPKKSSEHSAGTASASVATTPRKASVPPAAPTETAPVAPPPTRASKPEHAAPAESQGSPDPAAVAGVESVPDPALTPATGRISAGALIPVDVADTMPVPLSHKVPVFSAQAGQHAVSGTIVMNVLINDRGTVDQVVLVTGTPGDDATEAAIRAAKSWTYRPATKNGLAVKVWKSEQVVVRP